MKRLIVGTPMRTGAVAAVALTGVLLTSTPAVAAGDTAVAAAAQTAAAARPGNGRILYDRLSGGRGVLKVKNGTSRDGVITLVKGRTKAISFYVRARSTASVKDVRDGTYRIYFTTGYQFSTSRKRFTRAAMYQRFNDRLRFSSTATTWSVWTLTLHPVKGGRATTSPVDPKDFP
ncbi:MAG TPA: hypothetical protein VFV66_22280 [Nonomuraea sp.]|nr:hypothetical protein [Nonomuraea sp.]